MSKKPASAAVKSSAAILSGKIEKIAMKIQAANTESGHGVSGRHANRELLDTLSGNKDPGMFGRMFPKLKPLAVSDAKLTALAEAMIDSDPGSTTGNNGAIPAGFTYFGQFVDHDITLDLTSLGDKAVDPLALQNFRTPSVELDCVYGLGPDGSPHLYARNPANSNKPGPMLLIGKNMTVGFGGITGDFRNDLPRSPEGFALIADHRNDENLLVAQTHLAFLKFHNAVCKMLSEKPTPPPDIFSEARRIVTWHYQWIVLHDWVERLAGPGTVAKILHDGRKYYRFKKVPFMPVEFSAAAYRLGHSMVRQRYDYNKVFKSQDFQRFFDFTGLSGGIVGDLAPNPPTGPIPVAVLPSNWIIDWRRFHELGNSGGAAVGLTPSRRLDPQLVKSLHSLPGGGGNLAFRNMKRGVMLGLPSGQDVAAHMKIKSPLTPAEIASDSGGSIDGAAALAQNLHTATPLWYYILKEAKIRGQGERLGPVGATIISEVFVGLVHGDKKSYLWNVADWKPELPSTTPGDFKMADMLRFVNDFNPIGD
jgi:Animal haem peroxidase